MLSLSRRTIHQVMVGACGEILARFSGFRYKRDILSHPGLHQQARETIHGTAMLGVAYGHQTVRYVGQRHPATMQQTRHARAPVWGLQAPCNRSVVKFYYTVVMFTTEPFVRTGRPSNHRAVRGSRGFLRKSKHNINNIDLASVIASHVACPGVPSAGPRGTRG
jgi:hypothetical protein